MIDLHVHSRTSDGELTPYELLRHAADKGVTVLALTDHDTVGGISEAETAACAAGITLVRGVELNIDWPSGEFHLLGLGLRRIDDSLHGIMNDLQEGRTIRNIAIIEKMSADGYPVSYEELSALCPSGCLGRPHFADYFVQKGLVKNRQQAFDLFLAKGRPYFIGRKGADLDDCVTAIRRSGALPVLAHPLSLYVSWGKLPETLAGLKRRGVGGIEAWHPGAREGECRRLEALGRECGFVISAGSDFHGKSIRADRKIGHTAGKIKINDSYWFDELLPALEKQESW